MQFSLVIPLIFQTDIFTRWVLIVIPIPILSFVLIFNAILTLKRKRSRQTYSLGAFYLIVSIGLILNLISFLVSQTSLADPIIIHVLYYATSYFIIFGFIFLPLFINTILRLETEFTNKKYFLVVLIYGILSILIFLCPGGITLIEAEGWKPVYSLPFFFILISFYTVFIFIPTILYLIRLYKLFEAKNLRAKLRLFIIGIIGMLTIVYGVSLYNIWDSQLYRTIWGLTSFIIIISCSFLIYYGIGQKL